MRARLLAVARKQIAEVGPERVTVRELAAESGMSLPTLYTHFRSREELLVAAVGERLAMILEGLQHPSGARGLDRLLSDSDGVAEEMLRLPDYARNLLEMFARTGRRDSTAMTVARQLQGATQLALEEIQSDGMLAGWVDIPLLAQSMQGSLNDVSFAWAAGRIPSDQLSTHFRFRVLLMLFGLCSGSLRERVEAELRQLERELRAGTPDAE